MLCIFKMFGILFLRSVTVLSHEEFSLLQHHYQKNMSNRKELSMEACKAIVLRSMSVKIMSEI